MEFFTWVWKYSVTWTKYNFFLRSEAGFSFQGQQGEQDMLTFQTDFKPMEESHRKCQFLFHIVNLLKSQQNYKHKSIFVNQALLRDSIYTNGVHALCVLSATCKGCANIKMCPFKQKLFFSKHLATQMPYKGYPVQDFFTNCSFGKPFSYLAFLFSHPMPTPLYFLNPLPKVLKR